jgi:membrane protease YdiL (CAAX protease family)
VLAAMNSFAEEMLYRGVLLGPLLRSVTANQAVLMIAVLFGIAHYHGRYLCENLERAIAGLA